MMRFDRAFRQQMQKSGVSDTDVIMHYSSKGRIHHRLREQFGDQASCHIHEILMPTPIDGSMGPSLSKSLANLLLPVQGNPSLIRQIVDYLRQERKLYDSQNFDLVVSDGDIGTNILAKNRKIPCLFITNQFKPKLYKTRSYLYPALSFISKQIAKATKILVADSPPPHTICEYNLNFTDNVEPEKIEYVGHFVGDGAFVRPKQEEQKSELEILLRESSHSGFGYWMRTGNKSTNDGTGKRYEDVFAKDEMVKERRIISHAKADSQIDSVTGLDGTKHTIADAVDKKIDWIQIDVGFLSEYDKDTVLEMCDYAVINGSHTVMGEIMGGKKRPIIGVPIYDEHTNNIKWAADHGLGLAAENTKQIISAIHDIRHNESEYTNRLEEFAKSFDGRGAQNTARITAEILQARGNNT